MTKELTQEAPALVGIGAQSIVDRAKELGLTWTIRPATVVLSGTDLVEIQYDGDSESIGAINLSGVALQLADRVLGMIVPPSANFILGAPLVNGGRGVIAGATSTANSGAIGAQTVILTNADGKNAIFYSGRAYRLTFGGSLTASTSNVAVIRFQKNSTSGTTLAGFGVVLPNTTAQWHLVQLTVVNNTNSDIGFTPVVSLGATSGTVSANHFAPDQPYWFDIFDVGPSSDFPGFIAMT